MVLEAIVSPKKARQSPWIIAILAFIFVSAGILAADFLGIEPSIMMITFVSVPSIPFIWRLFDYEEAETEKNVVMGSRTVARHLPVILVLSMFFIGLIAGFVFWYFALPPDKVAQMYEVQITELKGIGVFSGQATYSLTNPHFLETFEMLFFHNLGVLLIIVVFSLLYGAGSVLVLVWNSAIIGVFIAQYAKMVTTGGSFYSLLGNIGTGALGLVPHGSFELLAYLVAALAGGILSSSVTREGYKTNTFILVLHDTIKLSAIAIILLAIGAFIEAGAIAG